MAAGSGERLRGLVFDKDGTLFDFQATWGAWAAELLADLAGPRAAAVGAAIGFDTATGRFAPHSPVIAGTTEETARLLLAHLPGWRLDDLIAEMRTRAARTVLVPAAPLQPLLLALRERGLALGLATNDNEAAARAHLDRAGVADLFDMVVGYDSGHGAKPEPGQIAAFLALTGLPAGAVAMVGDSLHDLRAARAAGVRGIGVLTGPAGRDELSPAAEVVLESIAELPDWVGALAG